MVNHPVKINSLIFVGLTAVEIRGVFRFWYCREINLHDLYRCLSCRSHRSSIISYLYCSIFDKVHTYSFESWTVQYTQQNQVITAQTCSCCFLRAKNRVTLYMDSNDGLTQTVLRLYPAQNTTCSNIHGPTPLPWCSKSITSFLMYTLRPFWRYLTSTWTSVGQLSPTFFLLWMDKFLLINRYQFSHDVFE